MHAFWIQASNTPEQSVRYYSVVRIDPPINSADEVPPTFSVANARHNSSEKINGHYSSEADTLLRLQPTFNVWSQFCSAQMRMCPVSQRLQATRTVLARALCSVCGRAICCVVDRTSTDCFNCHVRPATSGYAGASFLKNAINQRTRLQCLASILYCTHNAYTRTSWIAASRSQLLSVVNSVSNTTVLKSLSLLFVLLCITFYTFPFIKVLVRPITRSKSHLGPPVYKFVLERRVKKAFIQVFFNNFGRIFMQVV